MAENDYRIRRNYFLVVWRVPALIAWMIVMPVVFIICKACRIPIHSELPHVFHAGVRKILGIKVLISGQASQIKPTLYASNHISYIDIFVLGSIRAYYIAKSEVANWPVLGKFAKYQNTLFIERKAGRAKSQTILMRDHLQSGHSLILFAEGTSTDGTHVQPFKSSLFEAANSQTDENKEPGEATPVICRVAIQPVTVTYTKHAGLAMNQAVRDYYAWYATMPFAPHFAALFSLKKVEVNVHFHPVCYLDQFDSRKHCADHCQSLVAEKMAEFLQSAKNSR